jgi:uncharacterized protein YdcH (DUF465 family)
MKFRKTFVRYGGSALAALAVSLLTGCGSNDAQNQAFVAQNQEKEKLQAENQDFAQAAAENEEVQRLRKENQALPKLRSQYQETVRLKTENAQLRDQIAKATPKGSTNQPGAAGSASNPNPAAATQLDAEKAQQLAAEASTLRPGDEVLIDPKDLKQLLPDFDWEKMGRKEPIGVRGLIEKDGVQITNTDQLKEYGLTNFIIRRAPVTNPPPAQPPASP